MANYRNISMDFWQDSKVVDDFTPEDRYMYLYCMTNPHTNLCSATRSVSSRWPMKRATTRILCSICCGGWTTRMMCSAMMPERKEPLILNWWRYNWTVSDKLNRPLLNEIRKVKCDRFREYLAARYNERENVATPLRPVRRRKA